ncbi:MAG TPA: MarP family serine protease [Acidimicrobiales bacterium]|jgi:S1-C subfamily serine protease
MDWVDIALVVVALVGGLRGLRVGALVQVFSFGGFWLGLLVGALVSSAVAHSVSAGTDRTILTLAVVFGSAVVLSVAGRFVGSWSNALLRRHHLGPLDAALGVAVAVLAVLASAWVVGSLVGSSRYRWVDSAVERSRILRSVDAALPPVPSVFSRLESFLSAEGFPPVFVDLSPPVAGPVIVPGADQAGVIARAAEASTVKVLGQACGALQEGSGFVVGDGLVVTNAHVVAGEARTQVVTGGIAYGATPVLYDPSFDLAVLRTAAPLGPPLTIDPDDATRGTQAAALGYPENGPLTVTPAGVTALLTAQGRDIYNEGLVVRSVYQLDAVVRPGNSGGPLVDPAGQVVGVVFSRSTVDPDVGYALASPGVLQRVEQAEHLERAVSTQGCTAG